MKCKICESQTYKFDNSKILNKYLIEYFICTKCSFLQTEKPYWLEEAYKEPINIYDTGIMCRNIYLSKITANLLFYFFDRKADFLDYAGGYGIFTRIMRDIGFNFFWKDLYAENLLARGFEFNKNQSEFELITSFETFEHFENPCEELEKIILLSKNIFLTTNLLPKSLPKTNEWWYYLLETGQHISFYSLSSLKFLANKYELNLYSNGIDKHLLTKQKLNNNIFKFLYLSEKIGINNIINRVMTSKTIEDMNYVSKKKV